MRILVSNDDGYQAPGIVALAQAMRAFGRVEVVAPEHNNSAKSSALTLSHPLYVRDAPSERNLDGFRYINGTPADCVHIALSGLLDYRPDLLVSGINNGANLGEDTLYSGTVGAAIEGFLMGIPALAFSLTNFGWDNLEAAAQMSARLVAQLMPQIEASQKSGKAWLLNVNIPSLPLAEHKGFRLCRLGRRHPAEKVAMQLDPYGQKMYWIGKAGIAQDDSEGTDFHATNNGFSSVTPLQIDMTNNDAWPLWRDQM